MNNPKGMRRVRVEGEPIIAGTEYQLQVLPGPGVIRYEACDSPPEDHGALEIHYVGVVRTDLGTGRVVFPLKWSQGAATLTMRVQFDGARAFKFADLCKDRFARFDVHPDLKGCTLTLLNPTSRLVEFSVPLNPVWPCSQAPAAADAHRMRERMRG